eukprot:scaffold740_cov405-Prasinococcus_capsulatus_cf.AAC.5
MGEMFTDVLPSFVDRAQPDFSLLQPGDAVGEPLGNVDLQELFDFLQLAEAAYGPGPDETAAKAATLGYEIRHQEHASSYLKPAWYLAVHPQRRAVVLAIRGTRDPLDLITDSDVTQVPFEGSTAHRGMTLAAEWLKADCIDSVLDEVEGLDATGGRPCQLFVVGHSLGAGTHHPDIENSRSVSSAARLTDCIRLHCS